MGMKLSTSGGEREGEGLEDEDGDRMRRQTAQPEDEEIKEVNDSN